MKRTERETIGIETVGAMRAALGGMVDDVPISDVMGEALVVEVRRDMETSELSVEVR
jgi:hypothetical protein